MPKTARRARPHWGRARRRWRSAAGLILLRLRLPLGVDVAADAVGVDLLLADLLGHRLLLGDLLLAELDALDRDGLLLHDRALLGEHDLVLLLRDRRAV